MTGNDYRYVDIEAFAENDVMRHNVPFAKSRISFARLDKYATSAADDCDVEEFSDALGVSKTKFRHSKNMTHAHITLRTAECKLPSIKVKLLTKKGTRRKKAVFERLKLIHETIRPHRNGVFDAVVRISSGEMMPLRDLFYKTAEDSLIVYRGSQLSIDDFSDIEKMYEFVARIHRTYALLTATHATAKDTTGMPRGMFERHVLLIVKAFL